MLYLFGLHMNSEQHTQYILTAATQYDRHAKSAWNVGRKQKPFYTHCWLCPGSDSICRKSFLFVKDNPSRNGADLHTNLLPYNIS